MMEHDLTDDEERAIRSLERLAKRWPRSLGLFGASGTLEVRRTSDENGGGARYCVATILGIHADGGDGGDNW